MKVIRVPESELESHWLTPVDVSRQFTEDDFDAEWEVVRDSLRLALQERWSEGYEEDADFMIMDDRNLAWTQCGGIYSLRICCPDYVSTISRALANSTRPQLWAYHTVVEVQELETDKWGKFVIRAGKLILPDDGLDYSSFIQELC